MKKKLFSLVMLLFLAVTIVFTGCSPKGLQDNPPTDANVVSNGGMSVVKGDYLYYVNGYVDAAGLDKNDNKYGEVTHGAIYRTKIVNGEIVKDKDGFVEKTECVVPKVVGFGNGGFYIVGDYIYYATPYMNLSSDGVLQSSRVEFHRIKIDGTEDKKIYTTSTSQDNLDWSVYTIDNNVYITTYVDSKIISINTNNNSVVAEISGSTSYVILKETDYNKNNAGINDYQKYIYYTRAIETADGVSTNFKGNVICRLNVATGETTTLKINKDYNYTLKQITKDSIYLTKANKTIGGLDLLHKKALDTNWGEETKLSDNAFTNYYFCNFGDNLVIANDGTYTYRIESGVTTKIFNSSITVLGVYGNYAYYMSDTLLARIDLRGELVNGAIPNEIVCNDTKTYLVTNSHFIDFDNKRVYVYVQYTAEDDSTNYYLNYINEGDLEQRFVGHFADGDLPEKPEQAEKYGEDPDVEYIPHID